MNQTATMTTARWTSNDVTDAGDGVAVCSPAGLTESFQSMLNNPVLPSAFELPAFPVASKRKWNFPNRNPIHFQKAWNYLRGQSSHLLKAS